MGTSWKQNRLTGLLEIDYPVIQGPLGGLSSQRLAAAVSNFGGLGSFGAHSRESDAIRDHRGDSCSHLAAFRHEPLGLDGRCRCPDVD